MRQKIVSKNISRKRRHVRVRAVVSGTAEKPRLNVFRGLKHTYAQLIDDEAGKTLAGVHSKTVDKKPARNASHSDAGGGETDGRKGKTAIAFLVGKALAEKAKEKKITKVVFDRAGYKYHGRVQAVADGARAGGLKF